MHAMFSTEKVTDLVSYPAWRCVLTINYNALPCVIPLAALYLLLYNITYIPVFWFRHANDEHTIAKHSIPGGMTKWTWNSFACMFLCSLFITLMWYWRKVTWECFFLKTWKYYLMHDCTDHASCTSIVALLTHSIETHLHMTISGSLISFFLLALRFSHILCKESVYSETPFPQPGEKVELVSSSEAS